MMESQQNQQQDERQQNGCLNKICYSNQYECGNLENPLSSQIIEGSINLIQELAHDAMQKQSINTNSHGEQQMEIQNDESDSSYGDMQFTLKTNNVIKNILKQFYKFLTKKQNMQLVLEFIIEKPAQYSLKLIKRYFDRINYNNLSLIRIIKHQNYGKGFEYFLTFEAVDGLRRSKVKNIQEHIQCISYLKECCVNQKLISEINFYKKNKNYQL